MMRTLRLAAILVVAAASASTARGADPQSSGVKPHVWEGAIKVRPGVEIRVIFNVTPGDGGALKATCDIPDQGAKGLKVDVVTFDKETIVFDLVNMGMKFEGKVNAQGTEAEGAWLQGGGKSPTTLVKKDKATPPPAIVGKEDVWEGKIALGAGIELRLVFHVGKNKAGELMATMDSPDQGAKGLKVDLVTQDKDTLTFEIRSLAAKFSGTLDKTGSTATGTFEQRGMKFPMTLKKTEKVTELLRPQTPKPPFAYMAEDVSYPNKAAGISLSGVLTLPNGPGPFAAAIMISGSGAQDRDETLFQHKPFLVIADALTRRGVAVLRVDDRGVGGSSGNTVKSTSDDFAGDVQAGMAYLKTRREIDPHKIGLIGHSEGGLIAPMVAARSGDVAFIVMLAGTGLPGDEIVKLQSRLIAKTMGAKGERLDKQLVFQARMFEVVKAEKDEKVVESKLKAIFKEATAVLTDAEKKEAGDLETLGDAQIKRVNNPWFRFFLGFDPRPALAKVHCPVLALNGEKDLQVPPKENLAEIKKAVAKAGNPDVTVMELAGLNHLFQTCKTGAPSEYAQIEESFAPSALAIVCDWVETQAKKGK